MAEFSIIFALSGGLLIGLASLMLLLLSGRIAGISGILAGLLQQPSGDILWRLVFISGLIAGGLVLIQVQPQVFQLNPDFSLAIAITAGLLVGTGSRMGKGCTSGHGVCGIGRLSPRSILAALTFLTTGIIAATLIGLLLEGKP